MRSGKFVAVPKKILYNGERDSLMKKYKDKYLISVFYGIRIGIRFNYSIFNLEIILRNMGLNINENNINRLKESLETFHNEKIINVNLDIKKLTKTKPFKIEINECDNFFKLFLRAYEKIFINNKNRQDSKISLLNTYSYIQCRIYNNKDKESANKDGKYHVAFPRHIDFIKNIGIKKLTLIRKIDELVEMDLIRYKNSGNFLDLDGNIIKGANCYTNYIEGYSEQDKKYYWEYDIDGSNKLFRQKKIEQGYRFSNYKSNKKRKK